MSGTISAGMSAPLGNITPTVKPKRKILRRVGYGFIGLLVVLLIAHLIWNASGTNQWEPYSDTGGVQVWTSKTPGSNLVRVKAHVKVKSKLAGMVKLLEDLDSCVDAYCYDTKRIEQIPSLPGRAATYVRFKFKIPGLTPREYVLFAEHYQDPATKAMEINIISAPSKMPRDECCVRVTHLSNYWKLTPLKNGELDIEFSQDTDLGGLPYFFSNIALIEGTSKVMHDMQGLMDKDRYRNAKVDYIQELE